MRNNPHDKIDHGTFDWLGYDWGKVGDRNKKAVHPNEVYLPATVADLKKSISSVKRSPSFIVRANGHSDNNLVVGGAPSIPVICMRNLNAIKTVNGSIIQRDGNAVFVHVEAGIEIGEIEDELTKEGYSLPIAPDHRHITVGGFASAGGISAASHIYGLFVDNILKLKVLNTSTNRLKTVTGDKIYKHVGKANLHDFLIVELDLKVVKTNKRTSLLKQNVARFNSPTNTDVAIQDYINAFMNLPSSTANVRYVRGTWFRLPSLPQSGIIATFTDTPISGEKWAERNARIAELDAIGAQGGDLPDEIAGLEGNLKLLAWKNLATKPSNYQTYEDAELFTDKVIDSSVGTPTYMLTLFVPMQFFPDAFRSILGICNSNFGDPLGMFALYSRIIKSTFLSGESLPATDYVDISIFAGIAPKAEKSITGIVTALDDLADTLNTSVPPIGYPATRYMVTQTTFRPGTSDPRDPATYWE